MQQIEFPLSVLVAFVARCAAPKILFRLLRRRPDIVEPAAFFSVAG
ncbi:MAG: hypothetical protein U1F26_10890 [Lysobacterales bacterium]